MSVASLTVRCPAKINLGLRVLRRRADGYHDLATVFQTIDLWDSLTAHPAPDLRLHCDSDTVPLDERNLVFRAARRLQQACGVRGGAELRLVKRIPVGGGLGGGSSDAAAALILLSRLWGLEPGPERLTAIAAALGADVPFFLSGGTALGEGRGDRLTPLSPLGEWPLVLGVPRFGVSTEEVYRRWDEAAREAPDATRPTRRARLTGSANDVSVSGLSALKLPGGNDFGVGGNDLERVVYRGWPELGSFQQAMAQAGARLALLSGSGSTVFGLFAGTQEREAAIAGLRERFPEWRVQACRTVRGQVHFIESSDTR